MQTLRTSPSPIVTPPPGAGRWLTLAARGVLLLLAVYHVITGVLSVFLPELSRPFYETLYHFHPHFWEQYKLILKPWGAYALFTGAVLGFAFWDPRRYRGVVWCMVALLTIRVGYRLIFAEEAFTVFQIDNARNYLNAGLMVLWASVLGAWAVVDFRASPPSGDPSHDGDPLS